MEKTFLTKKRIFGYCAGDIFGGGAFTLVGLLFMNFLTDNIAISAGIVGSMLLIGKIWDAVIDPFIGSLSERIRSKHGKRRIFFVAALFHITAAFTLLWLPLASLPLWFRIIYYTLAYMAFATSFSLTMVPYHAMLPELTDDHKRRNKIVGIRAIFSNVSTLIAGTVPTILIGLFNKSGTGYLVMGLCFGVFYMLPWIFVLIATKGIDLPNDQEEKAVKQNIIANFIKDAKTVLRNRSFRIMISLYLLAYTAMDIFMAIFIYYAKWYLNMPGQYVILLGIFMVCQILSIPFYVFLANRTGKKQAFSLGCGIWAGGALLMFFLASPSASSIVIYATALIMAFGAGGVAYLPWAILPEVMDVEELISGKKKDGIYSGFMTFIRQLSQAVAMQIVGLYLEMLDYNVGQLSSSECDHACVYNSLTDSVKTGIKAFSSFAPFILLIAALLVSLKLPLTNQSYPLMKKEINERNADLKAQKVMEDISGLPYECLGKEQ
ncbi:MAG: MFS transporter [Bacilli bacterium]|jgi:oligogalacturonide transporter